MNIASPVFKHNEMIPPRYTCDGEDMNPPLTFNDVPGGTQSLVLIIDDPDAPVGLWIHWTVWNISPETREIKERSVPQGAVQGVTSFGKIGWGGPCPPSGTHRYFFKLYALDTTLTLSPETRKDELEEAMAGHILAQAEMVGNYQRK